MLPRTEVLGWHGILLSPGEVSSAEIGHTAEQGLVFSLLTPRLFDLGIF